MVVAKNKKEKKQGKLFHGGIVPLNNPPDHAARAAKHDRKNKSFSDPRWRDST